MDVILYNGKVKITFIKERMKVQQKDITIIPPDPKYDSHIRIEHKILNVAAYCRVSTRFEQQENSYEAQIAYYTKKIGMNKSWNCAGIYADEGKAATGTKFRDSFNDMIEDCYAGKIDLILTKSISRFARNTVDCLRIIRELKERQIRILFEKENIDTMDNTGELLITILSSQAHVETVVLLSHKKADTHINVNVEFGEGEGKIPVGKIVEKAGEK